MKKRGSHVGMMLSFLIFITFVVFLYGVVRPTLNTGQDKKSLVQYIETQMIHNTSSNLTATSIKIKENKAQDKLCIQFQNLLSFSEISMIPYPIITKDENQNIMPSYVTGNLQVPDLLVNRDNKEKLFFKVFSSPEFEKLSNKPNGLSCTTKKYTGTVEEYEIGSIIINRYIFEKNIEDFKTAYDTDYEELKQYLKIPPGSEFEFIFKKYDGTTIVPEDKEMVKLSGVYAEEIPIQYVDNQANIQSGFISIAVW